VTALNVVAFGGGHGLSATLRALRELRRSGVDLNITAVVTVADDGGSSGRIRHLRGGLPPGDLRQALAALADPADATAQQAAEVMQFRFDGDPEKDPLAGHAVGNLMLLGLMEMLGDPVAALDRAGAMVRAVGRVLPMSPRPLHIEATIRGDDPAHPGRASVVRGQHNVAVSRGVVEDVRLTSAPRSWAADESDTSPQACAEAVDAVLSADWLLFGPGSWFTSVIPHLLVPEIGVAIEASQARRVVTLNLAVELETAGLSLPDHLRALARYLPGLRVDVVLADGNVVGDPNGVRYAAESLGAQVVLAALAVPDGGPRHDPAALATALHDVFRGG
jgi:uncharacterized cofD-like protein